MASKPFYSNPVTGVASFAAADTTTAKVVFTFPATVGEMPGGGRMFSLQFTNDNASTAWTMQVFRRSAGNVNSLLGEISVPANAGINGAAVAEFFTASRMPALGQVPALLDGIPIGPGEAIWIGAKATITTGNVVATLIAGQA